MRARSSIAETGFPWLVGGEGAGLLPRGWSDVISGAPACRRFNGTVAQPFPWNHAQCPAVDPI